MPPRLEANRNQEPQAKMAKRTGAGRFASILALICGTTLAVQASGCMAASFIKSVQEDHGTYYRLTVKLAYKGEPQDFDIVVGCNVRQINYMDNSSTYEVGLVPTVFGRRMSDGRGLVVRPPDACSGETTANGRVQPDLLPIVVVYDDADTLDFGTAYLSEDAYGGPLSMLKFGGARIEKATRAEFDAFRSAQVNLVKRESYHSNIEPDARLRQLGLLRLTRPFGSFCQGYMRFRIPEELRPMVQRRWPEKKPDYWRADTYDLERPIVEAIGNQKQLRSDRANDPPHAWESFMEMIPERTADRGLATRSGGGLVSGSRGGFFPPSLYPETDDYQVHRWPAERAQWFDFLAAKDVFVTSDLDFRRGQSRGFAYCSSDVRSAGDEKLGAAIAQKPKVFRVDGQTVVSKHPPIASGAWIFERDEHVLYHFQISLESTRGDV